MIFALFLLMKNTSKSNLARKNICKSIWLSKIVSPAKSNLAITDDYSKVKINFYWDCDAWNPMRLTFYDLNFWITNWCFVNQISFCECQKFLTEPKSFHYWISPFEPYPKRFGIPKIEIGFPKHWLGLQKFWTLDFIASMGSNPWGSLIYITIDLLFHKSQWGILSSSISIYSNLHEIKMTPH